MSVLRETETALSTGQQPEDELWPAPETEIVPTWKVACDGDEAAGSGHPRVWLSIAAEVGWVDCGYCDKRFVIDPAIAALGA